ncbi:BON domain-containing protein [Ilyomonas limi]|uniref:BON domain-containing protein n=2 Tax=Ilyomonas limi TaxID=2575867 RepID=A0A4U3L5Q6_9BACT|nr:BON domain-containing protein [Ilyomonas limi]
MYGSGFDYDHGYGEGTHNFRQGNYDNRYGSQDYGRYNRSQDYGHNRNWDNDNRSNWNDRNDRNWWDKTKDEVASWFGDDDAERRRRMDERRENNYRGKGPKNYTRSSDRIKEDVNDRLSDAWDIDASDIDVSVDGNEVTLSGTVPSKQQKRRAEDIAESVSGVHNVQNNLRVKQQEFNQRNDWNPSGSSTSGSSYSGTNTGTTTGSSSTTGTTGTTSSPSNQVKIEKSSAS